MPGFNDVEGMPFGFLIDRRDACASFRTGGSLAAILESLRSRQGLVDLAIPFVGEPGVPFLVAYREHEGAREEFGFLIKPAGGHGGGLPQPSLPSVAEKLCALLARLAEQPSFIPSLFAEVALALRVALGWSSAGAASPRMAGGLHSWQIKRARAFIDARLASSFTTAEIARECNMSANHFARAFRVTHGIPPRQWVLRRRIEVAKRLLVESDASLAHVALACGFAEQSHFTRVFARLIGVPPGAWRRSAEPLR